MNTLIFIQYYLKNLENKRKTSIKNRKLPNNFPYNENFFLVLKTGKQQNLQGTKLFLWLYPHLGVWEHHKQFFLGWPFLAENYFKLYTSLATSKNDHSELKILLKPHHHFLHIWRFVSLHMWSFVVFSKKDLTESESLMISI